MEQKPDESDNQNHTIVLSSQNACLVVNSTYFMGAGSADPVRLDRSFRRFTALLYRSIEPGLGFCV